MAERQRAQRTAELRRVLRQVADPGPLGAANPARIGFDNPRDDFKQGCFAGAICSQQADSLAVTYRQIDVADRRNGAVTRAHARERQHLLPPAFETCA